VGGRETSTRDCKITTSLNSLAVVRKTSNSLGNLGDENRGATGRTINKTKSGTKERKERGRTIQKLTKLSKVRGKRKGEGVSKNKAA